MTSETDGNGRGDLEEEALAFVFGDASEDPGRVVTEGAERPGFDDFLATLERDVSALKDAHGASVSESVALARVAALRTEIRRWRGEHGAAEVRADAPDETQESGGSSDGDDHARGDSPSGVVSLDEARVRRNRLPWTAAIAGVVSIAATALFVVVFLQKSGPDRPPLPVAQAQAWASEVGEAGMGFAGTEMTPEDRGVLIGLVRELARPDADGRRAPGAEETARTIAAQATQGLGFDEGPERLRKRAVEGCAAILTATEEVTACESGVAEVEAKIEAATGER